MAGLPPRIQANSMSNFRCWDPMLNGNLGYAIVHNSHRRSNFSLWRSFTMWLMLFWLSYSLAFMGLRPNRGRLKRLEPSWGPGGWPLRRPEKLSKIHKISIKTGTLSKCFHFCEIFLLKFVNYWQNFRKFYPIFLEILAILIFKDVSKTVIGNNKF